MRAPGAMVVEDDERSAELVRVTLDPLRMEVTRARTLADARAQLADGLPDLILLDLRLPDGMGYDLARQVRAMPGGERVHIIAVSASVQASDRDLALASGCDDFIEKPISPRELVARLRRWQDEQP